MRFRSKASRPTRLQPNVVVDVADRYTQGERPAGVAALLRRFADDRPEPGVIVARGLPVGNLPATPPSPTHPSAVGLPTATLLAETVAALGTPLGYAPEHGGDVVQNLVPTKESATRQVSTSSAVTLELHTEAAFHPWRPDFLALLCLRGDPSAGTTYAPAESVAALLHKSTLEICAEPRFDSGIDESYVHGGAAAEWRTEPHPVLWYDGERWCCRLDADLTRGRDVDAAAALAALLSAVHIATRTVVLTPGDLLVLDNARVVHGRTPYAPRFDGTDRWLQRTFVHTHPLRIPPAELSGQVISTMFTTDPSTPAPRRKRSVRV